MWKPKKGKKLDCHKNDLYEASIYDNHAIGVYKQKKKDSTLIGHGRIECLTLVDNLSNAGKENRLTAVVTGKRKREFRLVVPIGFTARTKKRNIATILQ